MTKPEALMMLMSLPDEPALIGRGYRVTMVGKSGADAIKRDLGTAYVTHRRQDHADDVSCVVSVRRYWKMKLARWA